MKKLVIIFLLLLNLPFHGAEPIQISIDPQDLTVDVGEKGSFSIKLNSPSTQNLTFYLNEENTGIVELSEEYIVLYAGQEAVAVSLTGKAAGHVDITANFTPYSTNYNADEAFTRVAVRHSDGLDVFSNIVGWLYFVAWSVSFYPQIVSNFLRKNVIGMHFDYVALNIIGFSCYSIFNCGLYFSETIQDLYYEDHPYGLIPVKLNDVIFALHAVFATLIIIIQIFIYERGDQRVSKICMGIMGIFFLFLFISLFLGVGDVIDWLLYLYFFSYVKLAITIIKYIPQAYYNYERKSTEGWSIWNILLDFTGGILSLLQMFLLAGNYDDWSSIFGDPTKFGLGLFSVLFDVLFMVQHYILYPPSKRLVPIQGEDALQSPYAIANSGFNDEDNLKRKNSSVSQHSNKSGN